MIDRATSFRARALASIGLLVGFYILAIGMAVLLFAVPLVLADRGLRLPGQVYFALWAAAATIAWSILPRIDRFDPPFPRLTPAAQPRLFARLEDLARQTGQAMPAEVYALPDVNAWVAQRGGVMGIGGRRVMGLGLPLMQTFSQPELEATIAHELGHFHAGDTRLGPLVYKTRAAIGRTLAGLEDSVFQAPFRFYAGHFMRITQAISRHQEYTADRLAATTVGAAPLISGLRKMPGLAPAYDTYWRTDFGPALEGGVHPPLLEGFNRFLGRGDVRAAIARRIAAELETGATDPFDSHPSIPDRIRAVAEPEQASGAGATPGAPPVAPTPPVDTATGTPAPDPLAIDAPALALLDDVEAIERALVASMVAPAAGRGEAVLEALAWDDVGRRRILPGWQALVQREAAVLAGVTPAALPALLADAAPFARRLTSVAQPVPVSAAPEIAAQVLAMALGAALGREGWHVDATPEVASVTLRKGDAAVEPFDVLHALRTGALDAAAWAARCAALGIADLDLGHVEEGDAEASLSAAVPTAAGAGIAVAGETDVAESTTDTAPAADSAAAPAAEPLRLRLVRWVAVMLTAALVSALFTWTETPTGTRHAFEAVRQGAPIWGLLPVVLALGLLPFILRRERGIYASMVLLGGPMILAGIAAAMMLDGAQPGAGQYMTIVGSLCYVFAGMVGSGHEGVPLSSPLARLALLGRHGHLQAVRELGQQAGWRYVEPAPGSPAHAARGSLHGRACTVTSTYVSAFSLLAAEGKALTGYVLRIAAAAPFAVYHVAGGQPGVKLPRETMAIARNVAIGDRRNGIVRFKAWRDDGGPVDDATLAAIETRLAAGADFLRGARTILAQSSTGDLVLMRASSSRVTEDAATLREALEWLCALAQVLEGDGAGGR